MRREKKLRDESIGKRQEIGETGDEKRKARDESIGKRQEMGETGDKKRIARDYKKTREGRVEGETGEWRDERRKTGYKIKWTE